MLPPPPRKADITLVKPSTAITAAKLAAVPPANNPILSNSRSCAKNLRTFNWACINVFSNSSWTIQYSDGLSGKVSIYLW